MTYVNEGQLDAIIADALMARSMVKNVVLGIDPDLRLPTAACPAVVERPLSADTDWSSFPMFSLFMEVKSTHLHTPVARKKLHFVVEFCGKLFFSSKKLGFHSTAEALIWNETLEIPCLDTSTVPKIVLKLQSSTTIIGQSTISLQGLKPDEGTFIQRNLENGEKVIGFLSLTLWACPCLAGTLVCFKRKHQVAISDKSVFMWKLKDKEELPSKPDLAISTEKCKLVLADLPDCSFALLKTDTQEKIMLSASSTIECEKWIAFGKLHIPLLDDCNYYGVKLETLMQMQATKYPHETIPFFLRDIFDFIRQKGLNTEGIFRISSTAAIISSHKKRLNLDSRTWLESACVHTACNLLTDWLRKLPEPLLTYKLYEEFLSLAEDPTIIYRIIPKLPQHNTRVLVSILQLLNEVVAHSDVNLMHAKNLARIFGINLLGDRERNQMKTIQHLPAINSCAEILISTCQTIFDFDTLSLRVASTLPDAVSSSTLTDSSSSSDSQDDTTPISPPTPVTEPTVMAPTQTTDTESCPPSQQLPQPQAELEPEASSEITLEATQPLLVLGVPRHIVPLTPITAAIPDEISTPTDVYTTASIAPPTEPATTTTTTTTTMPSHPTATPLSAAHKPRSYGVVGRKKRHQEPPTTPAIAREPLANPFMAQIPHSLLHPSYNKTLTATTEEAEAMHVFMEIDQNQNGSLDYEEWQTFLLRMLESSWHESLSLEELVTMMQLHDPTEHITFDQFLEWWRQHMMKKTQIQQQRS
ncbi:rho GTPase-activating protein 22 [Pelomyxa schiedti]|nr:rho GTPase-activating protein 22 [Pelomyxa schiedti]